MKRHPLEILSLISGLLFVGFAAVYLLASLTDRTPSAAVTVPLLLAGLGAGGILAAITASDRSPTGEESLESLDSQGRGSAE